METKFLITLCFALSLCVEVNAEGEQEVKRGLYPFMAFLYYPDESVVDGNGARFFRGAVLIQPDWLVTSAVGPSILTKGPNGFPRKTLLARAGAITIDTNFTLNEDEDEQEREIIQIVRPYNHSATQWWHTDISLMKTLQPFNMTSAVTVTMLINKMEYMEKTCTILIYAKRDGNWTEDRNLMQLSVELLPPSVANCGHHFIGKTMTCASDSDENKNLVYDANFCQDNRGGPLICEGDVIGIQTYIDNDCKQPHLYQLLNSWENFISCGTEDKCHEEQCSKICDVTDKDPDLANDETPRNDTIDTKSLTSNEVMNDGSFETTTEVESQSPTTTVAPESELRTSYHPSTEQTPTERTTKERVLKESTPAVDQDTKATKSWPREKFPTAHKLQEQDEHSIRQPKVEAQQQQTSAEPNTKKVIRDGADCMKYDILLKHSIIFGFILVRLI